MNDKVTLVNEQDEVIGEMDKVEAHRGEGKLHRAISVYLFEKRENRVNLLIQQRSSQKIVGAHQWANTVCGNVRPDETYEACAYRRLAEELGITTAKISPLYKFQYFVRCNDEFSENEIDQVFVGWWNKDTSFVPNPAEVQSTQWVEWQSDQTLPIVASLSLAPWFALMLQDSELISKINQFLQDT